MQLKQRSDSKQERIHVAQYIANEELKSKKNRYESQL